MKNLLKFIVIAGLASCATTDQDLNKTVNPFIGTGGHGHTYPGATMPFGMVQLSPDTRLEGWDGCGGYHYSDSVIYGFSHTHLQGTGVSDYGDILLMPCTQFGKADQWRDRYKSGFNKESESANAGFYSVFLDDHGINAELTSTKRVGIHRYSLEEADTVTLVIDLAHRDKLINYSIYLLDDSTIVGHRLSENWATEQHVYFAMRFNHNFNWQDQLTEIVNVGTSPDGTELKEVQYVPVFAADFGVIEELVVKVGLSFCDIEGAVRNLDTEANHFDFDKYRAECESVWDEQLGLIEIEGASDTEREIFYTSLYHSCTVPNIANDVDGRYRGTDLEVHQLEEGDGDHYTIFSLWDTFRSLHPLLSWIEPDLTGDFVKTMLRMYEDGGQLPVWELAGNYTGCMIGYHSITVISDAKDWGIEGFNKELALEAMIQAADSAHLGLDHYAVKGYIPSECESESVSKTLEYAFDDACISSFANSIGNEEEAKRFRERAHSWRNLMHPESDFIQPKRDGAWIHDYDPTEVNFNYTEANGWQYTFFAPHDIQGQIEIAGSPEEYYQLVNNQFTTTLGTSGREQADITGLIGQYAHGNEPSHHVAYLFSYAGEQWRTAEIVDSILTTLYTDEPDGLCGNEDCGQMSAWYVLSSMGLYTVAPGSGSKQLAVGSPQFSKVTINPRGGSQLTISKNGSGKYVASLNSSTKSFVTYDQVTSGGSLTFEMTDTRKNGFGQNESDRPNESTPSDQFVVVPNFTAPQSFQGGTADIKIQCIDDEATIMYHTGVGNWTEYTGTIEIDSSGEFYAKAVKGGLESKTVHHEVVKIDHDWSVSYNQPYSHQYAAAGDNTLIDGLKGGTEFRTGDWQGFYYDTATEITIDLKELTKISEVSLGCIQDIKPWIWLPHYVEFYYSVNGKDYVLLDKVEHDVSPEDYEKQVHRFVSNKSVKANFIKVKAHPYGKIPDWHLGAGNTRWMFFDELEIR